MISLKSRKIEKTRRRLVGASKLQLNKILNTIELVDNLWLTHNLEQHDLPTH